LVDLGDMRMQLVNKQLLVKREFPRSRLYGGVILIDGYVKCINGKANAMGI
jgi:hypothetical protein